MNRQSRWRPCPCLGWKDNPCFIEIRAYWVAGLEVHEKVEDGTLKGLKNTKPEGIA